MITFKVYMLIKESISQIPVRELGLTSGDVPNAKPYGFWVDKSGNYRDVYTSGSKNNGGHVGVARSIITALMDYKMRNGELTDEEEKRFKEILPTYSGVYNVLLKAGFMHVVLAGNTYYYKTNSGMVSPSQKKFLTNLTDTYNTPTEYTSEIF